MNTKHLSEPWFSLIATGAKKVEGRLLEGFWDRVKIGDIIEFYNDDLGFRRIIMTKVVGILCYVDFRSFLKCEGLDRALPTVQTIEDGVRVYEKYYSPADQAKYGVGGFRIEVI